MTETLTPLDLRKRLGDVLNRVALRRDRFIISRKGKPLAAMVPVDQLELLREAARGHWLRLMQGPRPALTQEDADRIAAEAKRDFRRRRR